MKLLIDSSTYYLILSLIDKDKITSFVRYGRNDHSETLVDYLKKFLDDNKVELNSIKEIYIGRGPGSYTGVRISGVVGKVLSYTTKKPLYSYSSLDLLLCGYNEKVLPLIEANKDHYYYKDNDELFDSKLNIDSKYSDLKKVTYQDLVDNNLIDYSIKNLMDKKLFKEESNLDYNPNYIREVI